MKHNAYAGKCLLPSTAGVVNLLHEHNTTCDWGDPYASFMELYFAIAGYMHVIGEVVPADCGYHPDMMLSSLSEWDEEYGHMCTADEIKAMTDDDRYAFTQFAHQCHDWMTQSGVAY